MLPGLLLLAAEEAVEPSKVPFYVAGGAFAAWAVVLAAVGLSRPEFPRGAGAMRGVMLLSVALTAAAMVTAVVTS